MHDHSIAEEMDKRLYDTHMKKARQYAAQAKHATTADDLKRARTYVGVHLTAALAFAKKGGRA